MASSKAAHKRENHQLINQTSGAWEYYTPQPILQAARDVMGSITLDPASSPEANKHVQASTIYCEPAYSEVGGVRTYAGWGGLSQRWCGNVWVNPPFGTEERACKAVCTKKKCKIRGWCTGNNLPGMQHWVEKFTSAYYHREMYQGMFICFAATSERWFQPLLAYAQCFLCPRTNYYLPDGTIKHGVSKGSVVTYAGPRVAEFTARFAEFGAVK